MALSRGSGIFDPSDLASFFQTRCISLSKNQLRDFSAERHSIPSVSLREMCPPSARFPRGLLEMGVFCFANRALARYVAAQRKQKPTGAPFSKLAASCSVSTL